MQRTTMLFLCLALLAGFAGQSNAEDAEKLTFAGKVVDVKGKPVAGAKVGLYEMSFGMATLTLEFETEEEIVTKDDGKYSFERTTGGKTRQFIVLAEKEGLSVGWASWYKPGKKPEEVITLTEPKVLAGKVVGKDGSPVAGADVTVFFLMILKEGEPHYITSNVAGELFATKTNADGEFTFDRIPDGATAEFTAKKTGYGTVNTFNASSYNGKSLTYSVGQKDIDIEMALEAKIEGVVVEKGTGKPVGGVPLMIKQRRDRVNFGQKPVISDADGAFAIDGLTEGAYTLTLLPSGDKLADWVADVVEITTKAGETHSGVKIELSKGGVIEVSVTDPKGKPVDKASVSICGEESNQWLHCVSDDKGLARMRLLAGDYNIQRIHKEGFAGSRQQEAFTIQDNETVRKEIQLAQQPKITGTVRDEKGKPVEGASVKIYPMSSHIDNETDAKGKFELEWDPNRWGSRQENTVHCLVVRHEGRNLAAAVEIEEDTKTIEVELEGGVVFYGVVVNEEDKPIEGAKINVMLRVSNWGSPITDWQKGGAVTDSKGKFEVKAMPAGRKYNVIASGDEYGKSQVEALADDAEDDRLDVGRMTLALANLTVSGLVVDSDDKPVSGANLFAHGDNQSNHHNLVTDADGKFVIEKVCAGKIRISAHTRGKTYLSGNVETEGGASDVKIVIAERSPSRRFVPKQPKSLVGKSLPAFKKLDLQIDPNEIADKSILVCFWDMQQRPSRHCIKELVKKATELKEKNVVVIAVQASKVDRDELDEQVKKYNIPFPTGMIKGNEEKIRFRWGVKSLPWLILTDKVHVVSSNGFSLNELDEKLKQPDGE